jgi:hypothetical protein
LRTTDGCKSWETDTLVSVSDFNSLLFINSNTGYIAGTGGKIYKTTSAGENWYSQPSVTTNTLNSVYFRDSDTGYIVGNYGTILKTVTAGEFTLNISNSGQTIPNEFYLFQNYPNPFNPSTTIKFKVDGYSNVSLKIFDLSGKEVADLLNKNLTPGIYSVIWNASSFGSGVYYYRIQMGNQIETKKMVFIK